MNKLVLIGLILIAIFLLVFFKYIPSESINNSKANTIQNELIADVQIYDFQKVNFFRWDSIQGFILKKNPDFYLGPASFITLNNGSFAFISDASNELIITDDQQKIIKRINLEITPRDLIYDNGLYYILTESKVLVYDDNGKKDEIEFPIDYSGTVRLSRNNHSTYLLLPNGNSLCIEQDGNKSLVIEKEGWITSTGSFVKTFTIDKHNFYVEILLKDGSKMRKNFYHDSEIAGTYFCGLTQNEIIIELQTIVSEIPIKVKREILTIELEKGEIGSIIHSYELPMTHYVMSTKDIEVSIDGTVYFMISTPEGIDIFSLQKSIKQ